MYPNLFDILEIKKFHYKFNKYLIIDNLLFEYYKKAETLGKQYKFEEYCSQKLLLIIDNTQLYNYEINKLFLDEIIFAVSSRYLCDVVVLSEYEVNSYYYKADFLSNNYKKIIAIGNVLKNKFSENILKNSIIFENSDLRTIASNWNIKKDFWNLIIQ